MAPIPVVSLLSVVLSVVLTIRPVLCRQVTPVGAVFVAMTMHRWHGFICSVQHICDGKNLPQS